jgi:drug/metabolite transporter (DMT)-like permease
MVGISSRTTAATVAALIGFAANSVLCRMALGSNTIDAWSFTCIRLGSGAVTLFCLARVTEWSAARRSSRHELADGSSPRAISAPRWCGSWGSALALFTYASAFSLAYLRLSTGIGALVLFASVQATMIGWGIKRGEQPTSVEWIGLVIALGGLVLLTLPGAIAPDPIGLSLMMVAGIAWGAYSLRGRASRAPLAATADNFARSVPLALVGLAVTFEAAHITPRGIGLALGSGSIASGLGYSLWYLALPGLRAARAAVVQLVVPALAAALGIALLGEHLSARLAVSGLMILGGVGLAVLLRGRQERAGDADPSVKRSESQDATRAAKAP